MTPLLQRLRRSAIPRTVRVGDLAVVNSIECFTLASGHPLRGAPCLLCRQVIGSARVAVIGVAGLAGDACQCGTVTGDVFLIHAAHFPVPPAQITAALRAGLACESAHPVHR